MRPNARFGYALLVPCLISMAFLLYQSWSEGQLRLHEQHDLLAGKALSAADAWPQKAQEYRRVDKPLGEADLCAQQWQAANERTYQWAYAAFLVAECKRRGLDWRTALAEAKAFSGLEPYAIRRGQTVRRGLFGCEWEFARKHKAELASLTLLGWEPKALYDPRVSIRCWCLRIGSTRP